MLRPIRREWTKTQAGYRSVALPQFVVETLRRRAANAISNPLDLVFTTRNGSIYDPLSFRRSWRPAPGNTFAWVTPKTFRKSVATLIANEHGAGRAAQQRGHTDHGLIAQRHYIDAPSKVENFTGTLGDPTR